MKRIARIFAAGLIAAVGSFPALADMDDMRVVKAKASFADVKQDVADAIINRGYVIDHNAKVGNMLDRTGKAVGSALKIYNGAETVQFCSAVLSRKMMEADPANIVFCPYVIFYYERTDEPGTVYVGYRELDEEGSDASEAAKKTINKLLGEIIKEAAGVN